MACLRESDGIRPGVTPWLGSLVVNPQYRGHNVGEALINSIKDQAKNLGHQILYLLAFDPTIPSWYARLGWTHIGDDELFGHRVTVMSIPI
jgi:N-acetylglutamate synthase-like GNAT family acetyltransferase